MNVRVREAAAGDVEAVREVATAAWYAAYGGFLEPATIARSIERNYADEILETAVDHEEIAFFVAEVEVDDVTAELVGFASAERTWADEVELHTCYVHPDRWGEGTGGALLDRILEWARTRGVDRVVYAAFAENAVGIQFLEERGFVSGAETTVTVAGETCSEIEFERPV